MSTNTRSEGNTLPVVIILAGLLFAGFVPANAANAPTQVSAESQVSSVMSLGGAQSEILFTASSSSGILNDK